MPGLLGFVLIAIGVVHSGLSLALRRSTVFRMTREGLFGTVSFERQGRMALFWSVGAGFSWIIMGGICVWVERQVGVGIPPVFPLAVLAYSVLGAVLMPRSGFWLMIAGMIVVLSL